MKNIFQIYLNCHIILYLLFLSYIAIKIYFIVDTKLNYLKTKIENINLKNKTIQNNNNKKRIKKNIGK